MAYRDEQHHRSAQDIPEVGRPRGATWRSLQADGVVWEGQVLLVGDDVDLAARMIVTHRRVVFVRGGELVLEITRGWLRPEPMLRRDGILELFVTMPGANPFDEPMRVPIRMREGNAAASQIIAMLAPGGVRRIAPESLSSMERAREASPPPRFDSFWDDEPPPLPGERAPGWGDDVAAQPLPPIEPRDRVVRLPSTPPRVNTNNFPITGLQPRDQRRSSWGLVLRLSALAVLLITAAALGAGRLDFLQRPASSEAILAEPSATVTTTTEESDAALAPAEQTAIAMGVGGETDESTQEAQAATAQTSGTPAVAQAIPTPAATVTAPAGKAANAAASAGTATSESTAQPAVVSANELPAQEMVAGPLRLAITSAERAESLPKLGLPPGSGDWIVLILEIKNESEASATLPMSDMRLFDRGTGTVASLDSGTDVIASLAKFNPVRGIADIIELEPGQSTRAFLLFLLPPGSSDDLAFLIGQASMDLAPALAIGETSASAAPALETAKVVAVRDGARIDVEIDGKIETVRYLGMQAPTGDACFAAEAKAANEQLVGGKQVLLERQASDRDSDGALLRDVWVAPDGNRMLVSERLLQAGGGTAALAAPDTRYQAWLTASEALARSNGAGLWGVCAPAAAIDSNSTAAGYLSGPWRSGWASRLSWGELE